MPKTLYLWDLQQTLFREVWNTKDSGFPSYDAYVEAREGKPAHEVSALRYEELYEVPLSEGWYFGLDLQTGFQEVLAWAKHNETFSTGIPEQVEWRARYLNPRVGFDIRKYFQKLNSTFNYAPTNVKTVEMWQELITEKYQEGYDTIVYADDKEKNCELFLSAIARVRETGIPVRARAYHMMNDNGGVRVVRPDYIKVGTLLDVKEFEQKFV